MQSFITWILLSLTALFGFLFFKKSSSSEEASDTAKEQEQDDYRTSLKQAFTDLQKGLDQLQEQKKEIDEQVAKATPSDVEKFYEKQFDQSQKSSGTNATSSDNNPTGASSDVRTPSGR